MARAYSNFWSSAAARLTIIAHGQAAAIRWGVLIFLVLVWFGLGMYVYLWLEHNDAFEAVYRTLGAVSMSDDYFQTSNPDRVVVSQDYRNLVRFAALLVPVVGLLFAFSGALGRHLAQTFNLGARRHVVIAGDSAPALSLALDCRLSKDAVMLIGQGLSADTALALRRDGVIVIEGDATRPEVLESARAHHAAHVIAFEADDTTNLQIEACIRRLVGETRRKRPIGVHVATRSPLLLREAREMRSAQMRKHEKKKTGVAHAIDPKPFSLDELASRALVQQESAVLLDVASKRGADRVHIVFFGFDEASEALAERVLASLWSSRFEAPRLTVLTPEAEATEARFRARHREIFAHPALWSADMHFEEFDWNAASMGPEVLTDVEAKYGKVTAAVVSTGADPRNIHLAIALKRVCDNRDRWPIPIFMKESAQSEFSKEYARGDDTPDEFDAFLLAFGSHQTTATRALILDGALDAGAAIAHEHYRRGIGAEAMNMKELTAASRDWGDVMETYRAANRAVSDSSAVKVWDIGLRPARKGEKGETAPAIPADMSDKLARREHDRWVAERLLSGWRPTEQGEARDNDIMAHDKLVGWDALNEKDKNNDVVQVNAALNIARMMNKDGFVARS